MTLLIVLSIAIHAAIACLWLRRKPKPQAVIRKGEFDAETFETLPVGILLGPNGTIQLVNLETKKRIQFTGINAWQLETAMPQGQSFDTLPARILMRGVPAINGVSHGNGE